MHKTTGVDAYTMTKRNRLLGMKKPDSISAAEMRLQRYIDVDRERSAKEKFKLRSFTEALKAGKNQGENDLQDANAKAAKITNGADEENIEVPEWRAEAARRLAAAETKWPHKLGANLQKWRGKKVNGKKLNGISGRVRKT